MSAGAVPVVASGARVTAARPDGQTRRAHQLREPVTSIAALVNSLTQTGGPPGGGKAEGIRRMGSSADTYRSFA